MNYKIFLYGDYNGGYNVVVPAFNGFTSGENHQDSLEMARDLIKLLLEDDRTKSSLPDQSTIEKITIFAAGRDWQLVLYQDTQQRWYAMPLMLGSYVVGKSRDGVIVQAQDMAAEWIKDLEDLYQSQPIPPDTTPFEIAAVVVETTPNS